MAIDLPAPSGAKLPLWHTIGLAYSSYFHNFPDVLRASWLWLLVVATMAGIANWLQWTRIAGLSRDARRDQRRPRMRYSGSRDCGSSKADTPTGR